MILLNDFYTIVKQSVAADSVLAKITINEGHKIFKGHFPETPLVPGVCMVQIILEILGSVTGKPVRMVAADTIKFLAIINPHENKEVEVNIQYTSESEKFLVTASLFAGPVIFFKLKAAIAFA